MLSGEALRRQIQEDDDRRRRRLAAMFIPGSGAGPSEAGLTFELVDRTAGTNIGNMTAGGGLIAAFDGITDQTGGNSASRNGAVNAYVGKTHSSPLRAGYLLIHPSSNQGVTSGAGADVRLDWFAKNGAAPFNGTDGTVIGTTGTIPDPNGNVQLRIDATDTTTEWDHWWVFFTSTVSGNIRCAELIQYRVV